MKGVIDMNKKGMNLVLKIVGIVVAAGTLVTAIFQEDDEERIRRIAREEIDSEK
jgi:uncharacterized protein (UPF0297 family)